MKKAAFYLILVLLPAILSLAAGEIMTRVLAPQNMTGTWLSHGPRGLVLNRADWTVRHQFGDITVDYSINADGHRGPARRAQALPVLVLGDSFTFGWLLDDQDNYVADLQRRAETAFGAGRVQLMNAAVGGWGAGDQLAYLEEMAEPLSPHLVMVFVGVDDFARAERWPLYVMDDQGRLSARDLTERISRLKTALNAVPGYSWLLEQSHLIQLLRSVILSPPTWRADNPQGIPPNPAVSADGVEKPRRHEFARALYARMKDWCDTRGVQFVVVSTGWPDADYPWLAAEMNDLGIDFIDLTPKLGPIFRERITDYYIPGDGHVNATGAALIAEAAWPELKHRLGGLLGRDDPAGLEDEPSSHYSIPAEASYPRK